MHPVEKGDITVAMLTARFLQKRWVVLRPISELSRYDLVIDRGHGFERVQCKTGCLRKGSIIFRTASSMEHRKKGATQDYRGQIDLFGVYCHENDMCFLVPVDIVGIRMGNLRVEESRSRNKGAIRDANLFRI